MAHYDHTYVAPGESGPAAGRRRPTRPTATSRPTRTRSPDSDFTHGRRHLLRRDQPRPQEGRSTSAPLMRAVADQDHPTLERWAGMADAETAVVQDAHLGGYAGVPARHRVAGRCRAAASRPPTARTPTRPARCSRGRRRRPPGRSTRRAATARSSCWPTCPASTAHRTRCATCSSSTAPRSAGPSSTSTGPIVFCVVSRYHGGAFVVFSKALNPRMTVLAVEGSFASVHRRRAGRGGGLRRRGRRADGGRPAGRGAARRWPPGRAGRAGRARRAPRPRSARPCGPRSSARWRPSSTRCTASTARSRSVRSTR